MNPRRARSITTSIPRSPRNRYPLRAVAAVVYAVLMTGGFLFLFFFAPSTHSLSFLLVAAILLGSVLEEIRTFVRVRSQWIKQTRSAANFCQNCGYDLRASPKRCPECGGKATLPRADTAVPEGQLEIKVQLIVSRILMAGGPITGLALCLGKEAGLVYVGWLPILFFAVIYPLLLSVSWVQAELAWRRYRGRGEDDY